MSDPGSLPAVESLYDLIGEAGLRQLVAMFYRQIPTDPVLGPMYPGQALNEAEQRLADFLIFRCGGPDTYLQQRGHPRLRMRHAPFPIDQTARDRWVALMDNAFSEIGWPAPARISLQTFLHDSASFLINR